MANFDKQTCISRYLAGDAVEQIAREFSVTVQAVYWHLRGTPKRAPRSAATGTMNCTHCGKEFSYLKSHASKAPRLFCSNACWKVGYRGEIHGNRKASSHWVNGYEMVFVPPESISRLTTRRKRKDRAPAHIVKAEAALGRPLRQGEVVHHINCDKADNRNSNLIVCDFAYHAWLHGEMSRRYAQEKFGRV